MKAFEQLIFRDLRKPGGGKKRGEGTKEQGSKGGCFDQLEHILVLWFGLLHATMCYNVSPNLTGIW